VSGIASIAVIMLAIRFSQIIYAIIKTISGNMVDLFRLCAVHHLPNYSVGFVGFPANGYHPIAPVICFWARAD
jgi:hypothetical protein